MKPEVHFLTFATADLDAARDFYKEGLGWEPILDVKGVILYFQVAPGLVLGLFDALKFDRDLNGELITAGISGVTLTWNLMHLAAMIKQAGGYPRWGNLPNAWAEGERFGFEPYRGPATDD